MVYILILTHRWFYSKLVKTGPEILKARKSDLALEYYLSHTLVKSAIVDLYLQHFTATQFVRCLHYNTITSVPYPNKDVTV